MVPARRCRGGGHLTPPLPARWESYLTKAEAEAPKVKARTANAPTVNEQATTAANTARDSAAGAYDHSTDRAPGGATRL